MRVKNLLRGKAGIGILSSASQDALEGHAVEGYGRLVLALLRELGIVHVDEAVAVRNTKTGTSQEVSEKTDLVPVGLRPSIDIWPQAQGIGIHQVWSMLKNVPERIFVSA